MRRRHGAGCCDCICALARRILCHKRLTLVKEYTASFQLPLSRNTASGGGGGDDSGGGGRLSRAAVQTIVGQSSLWDFDPFREYCSVMLNFCWVCFFSVIFPWGALCAFVNNNIEIRADMYKLSSVMQRPFPRHATSTGPWQGIQDLVVRFSTIVNVALLVLTLDVFSHFFGADTRLGGIKWEHALLGVLLFCLGAGLPTAYAGNITEAEQVRRNALFFSFLMKHDGLLAKTVGTVPWPGQ